MRYLCPWCAAKHSRPSFLQRSIRWSLAPLTKSLQGHLTAGRTVPQHTTHTHGKVQSNFGACLCQQVLVNIEGVTGNCPGVIRTPRYNPCWESLYGRPPMDVGRTCPIHELSTVHSGLRCSRYGILARLDTVSAPPCTAVGSGTSTAKDPAFFFAKRLAGWVLHELPNLGQNRNVSQRTISVWARWPKPKEEPATQVRHLTWQTVPDIAPIRPPELRMLEV